MCREVYFFFLFLIYCNINFQGIGMINFLFFLFSDFQFVDSSLLHSKCHVGNCFGNFLIARKFMFFVSNVLV